MPSPPNRLLITVGGDGTHQSAFPEKICRRRVKPRRRDRPGIGDEAEARGPVWSATSIAITQQPAGVRSHSTPIPFLWHYHDVIQGPRPRCPGRFIPRSA